jgi:signal transduction histidine kinase
VARIRSIWHSFPGRYAIAVIGVAGAVALTSALTPLHATPDALFILSVLISAWLGGPGPAAVASVLSLIAVDYFFVPPIYDVRLDTGHLERAAAFGVILACVIWFTETRRQLERELRDQAARLSEQAKVLERTEAELTQVGRRKDEFLAVLSHELRNPLGALRNGLHLLRDGSAPSQRETVHGMLDRQLQKLIRLVDDLLDVTRINSGTVRLRRERLELAGVVRDAVESSRGLIEGSGHALTVRLPEEPIRLEADRVRLAQVLSNLLDNAAKFTAPGGQIWLSAEREGGEISIRIKDSGVGIPADMLSKVFDMFTQIPHTGQRPREGLGIGLSIVRRLVELHRGTIRLTSEGPGRGSEFEIRLPALAAPSPVPAGPPTPATDAIGPVGSSAAARRVLVVDDDRDSAESMALVLGMMGHQARMAGDGPAALRTAEAFRPDVVLLDLGLPGMTGYEVAQHMREDPRLPGVTIIAVTGWGQDVDRSRSLAAGFDRHLVKPVDLAALRHLIQAEAPVAG